MPAARSHTQDKLQCDVHCSHGKWARASRRSTTTLTALASAGTFGQDRWPRSHMVAARMSTEARPSHMRAWHLRPPLASRRDLGRACGTCCPPPLLGGSQQDKAFAWASDCRPGRSIVESSDSQAATFPHFVVVAQVRRPACRCLAGSRAWPPAHSSGIPVTLLAAST
jgi:hypothetical protein